MISLSDSKCTLSRVGSRNELSYASYLTSLKHEKALLTLIEPLNIR